MNGKGIAIMLLMVTILLFVTNRPSLPTASINQPVSTMAAVLTPTAMKSIVRLTIKPTPMAAVVAPANSGLLSPTARAIIAVASRGEVPEVSSKGGRLPGAFEIAVAIVAILCVFRLLSLIAGAAKKVTTTIKKASGGSGDVRMKLLLGGGLILLAMYLQRAEDLDFQGGVATGLMYFFGWVVVGCILSVLARILLHHFSITKFFLIVFVASAVVFVGQPIINKLITVSGDSLGFGLFGGLVGVVLASPKPSGRVRQSEVSEFEKEE
ncbi:MAG: hypothetical protein COT34_00835 [Candidatus Nealsonbacteria bacterium CG08_land_8_20_14_0_20_43_11]|uniref:Uncharacterized protein n=1 Tax=Candidatus Nealsonbacteria bacterium CG08_land_8_20_14_0_20_43_11 TaxID=1974706 RepID=A0A2M6T1L1_9BACT|nr:MAG: hypothetical protein COT34_00835 [Candidatus Nealsonbacteria bacterium CG08_land_8_20_14_0_20_43_11]